MFKECRTLVFIAQSTAQSPILRAVHWLPVESCVLCKILPLTDVYITEQLSPFISVLYISHAELYIPSRQLRSSADTLLLRLLSAHLKSYGRRAFFLQGQYYSGTTYFTVYFARHG